MLKITETILRDAHQSQAATRMKLSEMLPVADKLDRVGYFSLESWGGATFDSCLRFLNEDPWERLRKLKEAIPNTRLQMLLRGQNLLGYKNYADDLVDIFVKKMLENGIGVVRMFDALNDTRNLEASIKAVNKYKKDSCLCEVALSYTQSPVHSLEYFADLAVKLKAMGADILCIKDMANLLLPYDAYELVKAIKTKADIPVHLHTHNTSGTGDMTYLKAVEAGVDIIDTALSPLANGTSQPTTESIVAALQGTQYDTGLDLKLLNEIAIHFNKVAARLKADGFLSDKVLKVDINALIYQVPGGMLSNLINQLKEQGKSEKLTEVLEEVPRVRKDAGYPPLVTPTSQIVGTQAVLNVVAGERYKLVGKEFKGLLRGEYGQLPAEPNEEIVKKCIGDAERITCRMADTIPPEWEDATVKANAVGARNELDVLSFAMFPQVAPKFFDWREKEEKGLNKPEEPKAAAPAAPVAAAPQGERKFAVKVNGNAYNVAVEEVADFAAAPVAAPAPVAVVPVAPAPVAAPAAVVGQGEALPSPMPGTITKVVAKEGATVKAGDVIVILEAMKMENDIVAPRAGVVSGLVSSGTNVQSGDTLAYLA